MLHYNKNLRSLFQIRRKKMYKKQLQVCNLGSVCFDWNWFPENRAFGCAVKFGQTENVFSLTEKSAKNYWNWFQSLFSLQIVSSPLSHARAPQTRTALSSLHYAVKPSLCRNHPHRRTTIAISPVTGTAPIDVDHDRDRDRRDCDRDLADRDRDDRDRNRDLPEKICCPSGFYLSF